MCSTSGEPGRPSSLPAESSSSTCSPQLLRTSIAAAVERELAALEEMIAARYAPFRVLDAGGGVLEIHGPRGASALPAATDRDAFIRRLVCELNLAYAAGVVMAGASERGAS